jgi:serine/threonine protein kinase/WD40 repeat protein
MALEQSKDLVSLLREHKLLEPSQLAEAEQLAAQIPTAKALAGELLKRAWLTPYQINQIFKGKAAELKLGIYHLLERIGEGGMGQVFKARHIRMGRIDALKVIKKERLSHPDTVRRFLKEIRAASQLEHPNVVRAYEADQDVDTHFFSMEFVEGHTLTQRVREKGPLPVADACDFMRQAALGLQHAHDRGLVHRDIKPANLLVTKAGNVLKILDMGLARTRVEGDDIASQLTQEGQVMGTPDYIAPEQAMDAHDVDIRADIYSLGCTMFFVLTGRVPFPGGTMTAKLMRHQKEEPPPVSQLRPDVPPGVEEVVKVMMAKRPEDRFQTPGQLAVILGTVLQVGSDAAEKLSSIRLRSKAAAATPAQPAAGSQAIATATEFTLGDGSTPLDPFADLDTAVGNASDSKSTIVKAGPGSVDSGPGLGQRLGSWVARASTPLEPLAEKVGLPRDKAWILTVGGAALILVTLLLIILLFGGSKPTEAITEPPPPVRKSVAVITGLDNLDRNKIPAGERVPLEVVALIGESRGRHQGPFHQLALSPDGQTIASAGNDVIFLWETESRKLKDVLRGGGAHAHVAFAADGKRLFTASGGFLRVFDLKNPGAAPVSPPQVHVGAISAIVPLKDGKTLITADRDGLVLLWDVTAEPEVKTVIHHFPNEINALALSPDEKTLAVAELKEVHLLDMKNPDAPPQLLSEPEHKVTVLAFSVDGKALAAGTGHGGKKVHVWDLKGSAKERCNAALGGGLTHVSFVRKSQYLVCAGQFADATILNVAGTKPNPPKVTSVPTNGSAVVAGALDSKKSNLVLGLNDSTVRVYEISTPKPADWREVQPLQGQHGPAIALSFSADNKFLAVGAGAQDRTVRVWDLGGAGPVEKFTLKPGHAVQSLVIFPDSKMLAAAGPGLVTLYDMTRTSAAEVRVLKCAGGNLQALAVSPNSRWLVVGGSKDIYLWDLQKATDEPEVLAAHTAAVSSLVFAPDGKTLFSTAHDKKIVSWDMTASPPAKKKEATTTVTLTRLQAADDKLVYAAGQDNHLQQFDMAAGTGKELSVAHFAHIVSVSLAADGKTLVSADGGGTVKWWSLPSDQAARERKLEHPVHWVEMAPDGRHFAVGTAASLVYIFRLAAAGK